MFVTHCSEGNVAMLPTLKQHNHGWQRVGDGDQSAFILVLNNRGTWNGTWVQTRLNNIWLVPAASRGHDEASVSREKWSNESGWVDLWAPPRGYTVYLPE